MRRMILLAPAICAIAFATMTAWAEDPKESRRGPQPPHGPFDPARLFSRLDIEEEGAISLDKLPERLPERLKEMLVEADADGDGKVTREEFKAAFQAARQRMAARRKAAARERPARPDPPRDAKQRPSTRERSRAAAPPRRPGPPGRRAAAPPRGPAHRPMPDLKALFARMDRDKSGELSLEEFTEGMRRLRAHMMRRHAQVRPPMGPYMRGPMGPPPGFRPGTSWHRGASRPPRDPAARPAEAKPRERPEARPHRARGPREEQPKARSERRRKPRGDESEAKPERRRRPRGEESPEEPTDEA